MRFHCTDHPDTMVELWEGDRYIATITATASGMVVSCNSGVDPRLSITTGDPADVDVTLQADPRPAPIAQRPAPVRRSHRGRQKPTRKASNPSAPN